MAPKSKPPNLGEGVNEGDEASLELTSEKNNDRSCKQDTFEMFSTPKGMSKEARHSEQDEFSRTGEFGFIVVEQVKSKIESS